MKKLILLLSTFLFFNSVSAKEYKVGDLMPDYKKGMHSSRRDKLIEDDCFNWTYNYFEKDDAKNKVERFLVAFSFWNTYPFLIYDFKNNVIYYDLKDKEGKLGADGKIDYIQNAHKNPTLLPIERYNPMCKFKKNEKII